MAGHPTIGSTFALVKEEVIVPGQKDFVFGLGVGPTPVSLEWKGNTLDFAWMTQLRPTFGHEIADRASFARALGAAEADLASSPVQVLSCGVPFLYAALASRRAVDAASMDREAFASAPSTHAIIAVDNSSVTHPAGGAVYKGLAIAKDAHGNAHLYATNFRSGTVEMYNDLFHAVSSPPAFVDPGHLPDSYAPFNIVETGGKLVVTYAAQDAARHDDIAGQGHGFVNIFNLDGSGLQRFAQHGQLDSPWGVAAAPAGFGEFAGALLIGNFGNGHINAFDPVTGEFLGKVRNPHGQTIVIDGLWTLRVGNGASGGDLDKVYFSAGLNHETHGLFGSLCSVLSPTCP
jgi:uncharacterized protein (TIGR03118 family)